MKTLRLIVLGIALVLAGSLQAQISVNINLGTPPQWGPVGYSDARYYYLPDVESYYDVRSSRFIYLSGGQWIHRSSLPLRYRSYDLYNGYKVVMQDYHGNTPYIHFKDYKIKYAKGYRGPAQKMIGNKPGKSDSKKYSPAKGNNNKKENQSRKQNESRGGGKGKKK